MKLTIEGQPQSLEGRSLSKKDQLLNILNPQNFALRCREVRMAPPNRIALGVGMVFIVLATSWGNVQGAGLANTTATSTPDALATQIANAKKELDDIRKRQEQIRELENINKEKGYLLGTPRPQPTQPPTPTPDPDLITIKRGDFNTVIKTGVDTALAARPTPTPIIVRERVVERVTEERRGDDAGGGIPGILWPVIAAAGGALAFARRQQIRNLIIHSGAPNWRIVTWARTHGGDIVIQSTPVQFIWTQVRRVYGI